jgi:hypothetical protein
MSAPEQLIPEQHKGIAKEVHHEVTAANKEEAEAIYRQARERLLKVNEWAGTAEGVSARFLLCDSSGNAVDRLAQQGDLVRIDLPGPHRSSGSGFDWVILETVKEGQGAEGPWIVLTTRPAPDPFVEASEGTAHFFAEGSTGTFLVCQKGNTVEGTHFGRNEMPNTDGSLMDEARAVLVTIGAYLGLSDVQWSNLVKGLLERRG